MSVAIHDDDIFVFEVHDRGHSVISGAVPDPAAFFGIDAEMLADIDPSMLEAMDAPALSGASEEPDYDLLVRTVGRGDVDSVRTAYQGEFVFATERREAIAKALGLPLGAVGWGYRYLDSNNSGYQGPALVRI